MTHDVVVVGAGFGGLGAALSLAEGGARVLLTEALTYPGGCASTFSRGGYRFEAGATLFSGFDEGQLFRRWIDAHGLPVAVDRPDPVVEYRAPGLRFPVPARREEFVARFLALPGAPVRELRDFFALQGRVADTLWGLLDEPDLLPPLGGRALLRHARRLPRYLPLLRLAGRPLGRVLRRFGLHEFPPLAAFLDALCQITVQCGADEAEAPFALAVMDYFFRGTAHVRGGIGTLATALADAVGRLGGDVRFGNRAYRIERAGDRWRVHTRRGVFEAPQVALNLLPQGVRRLLGAPPGSRPRLDRLAARVEEGWGACMLYLVVRPPAGADGPRHLQLVGSGGAPLTEGNHVFCSVSGPDDGDRAPRGYRTMTVSTHVPMRALRAAARPDEYVRRIQQRMRETILLRAPEWLADVAHDMTASPRTFERFTSRDHGYVGGIPRRAGLRHYLGLGPVTVADGLHLVGDTAFPGQSALATAVGGTRLARRILGGPRAVASNEADEKAALRPLRRAL